MATTATSPSEVEHALDTGKKYAVRFTLGDDDPITRRVVLRARR